MRNNLKCVEKPLQQAINKMMLNFISLQQVQDHSRKLVEIERYDRHEKKYLLDRKEQQVKEEDYYDSDSEVEQSYRNLDQKQLNYLIRKKLIYLRHSSESLENVVLYNPDSRNVEEPFPDSATDINDAQVGFSEGEKKLIEANQIFYDELSSHKSLKALKYIIQQLEKAHENADI